jgi:hypothetical protein
MLAHILKKSVHVQKMFASFQKFLYVVQRMFTSLKKMSFRKIEKNVSRV